MHSFALETCNPSFVQLMHILALGTGGQNFDRMDENLIWPIDFGTLKEVPLLSGPHNLAVFRTFDAFVTGRSRPLVPINEIKKGK